MKKLSYFAALAALLMSASCQKEVIPTESSVKDPVFTAIISNDDTKTSLDLSTKKVSWNPDDEITIADAIGTSVVYKVTSIDAQGKATFEKKEGETGTLGTGPYTATYGQAPSTSQTYSTEVKELPMSAVSETCSLTFTVSCGLLKVALTQEDISISSIAVSNGTKTYTLTCSEAVTIANGATFYIAVPDGTYTSFKFTESNGYESFRTPLSIAVEANHIKPVSSDFGPAYKENGTLYGYGSKVNDVWWAPVNCGCDASNPDGLLYQWGRKVGCAYNSEKQVATASAYDSTGFNKCPIDTCFYTGSNWYTNSTSKALSAWPMNDGDEGYVAGKIDNPCPEGWKVPTKDEFSSLIGIDYGTTSKSNSLGVDKAKDGRWFNGSMPSSYSVGIGIKLLFSGIRHCDKGAYQYNYQFVKKNLTGYYWTSDVDSDSKKTGSRVVINDNCVVFTDHSICHGCSVRCVKE